MQGLFFEAFRMFKREKKINSQTILTEIYRQTEDPLSPQISYCLYLQLYRSYYVQGFILGIKETICKVQGFKLLKIITITSIAHYSTKQC